MALAPLRVAEAPRPGGLRPMSPALAPQGAGLFLHSAFLARVRACVRASVRVQPVGRSPASADSPGRARALREGACRAKASPACLGPQKRAAASAPRNQAGRRWAPSARWAFERAPDGARSPPAGGGGREGRRGEEAEGGSGSVQQQQQPEEGGEEEEEKEEGSLRRGREMKAPSRKPQRVRLKKRAAEF